MSSDKGHTRRKIAAVFAWAGAALVLAGSLPTFNISWWWITRPETAGRVTEGVIASVALAALGLLPALIGGFLARSKVVSWGVIIAGGIYLLAFIPWAIAGNREWVTALPPGVICVLGGCSLLTTRHRGWWFAAALVLPVAAIAGYVLITVIANQHDFQAVKIPLLQQTGGEVTLPRGYFRLVSVEPDGHEWEYLRVMLDGNDTAGSPPKGKLLPLHNTGDIPLDKLAVPSVDAPDSAFPVGFNGMGVYRYGQGWWSMQGIGTCVTVSSRAGESRYVVFRLKDHAWGERMVLEYRYVQPAVR